MLTPKELAAEADRFAKMTPEQREKEMHCLDQKVNVLREMRMADHEAEAKKMYPATPY